MESMSRAKGTFEVSLTPEWQEKAHGISFGRFSIAKTFVGDLEASGKVTMLSAGSDHGSGAYVAIEQVVGKLNGKAGSFVLMHNGTRTKDRQQLTVTTVPGCGAGDLEGITGTMIITIVDKVHYYEFNYSL